MLISCQKCDAQISDKADSCPKCDATKDVYLGAIVTCTECENRELTAYPACRECGAPMPAVTTPEPEPESELWNTTLGEPPDPNSLGGPPAQSDSDGGDWVGKVLAFLLFALAFGGVRVWNHYNSQQERSWDRQDTIEILMESDQREFFEMLQTEFPSDFDAVVSAIHSSVSDPSVSDQEAFEAGFNATRDFTLRNAGYVFLASEDHLDALISRTVEMLEVTKTSNPEVCAAFASGQAPTAFESGGPLEEFQDLSTLTVNAIVSGKKNPTQRAVAAEDEWIEILELIMTRIEPSTATELESVEDPLQMSTGALCDFGLKTIRVIDAMPKEKAAYWYANMYRDTAEMLDQ